MSHTMVSQNGHQWTLVYKGRADNLLEEGISYNKQCYKNFTNKIHNGRAKATHEKWKKYLTLKNTTVTLIKMQVRGHSKSLKVTPLDR